MSRSFRFKAPILALGFLGFGGTTKSRPRTGPIFSTGPTSRLKSREMDSNTTDFMTGGTAIRASSGSCPRFKVPTIATITADTGSSAYFAFPMAGGTGKRLVRTEKEVTTRATTSISTFSDIHGCITDAASADTGGPRLDPAARPFDFRPFLSAPGYAPKSSAIR